MLERIVLYLHSHLVPFRLSSHPSPEPRPLVAHRPPSGGLYIQTHILLAGAEPAIACTARGAQLSLPRLRTELGIIAVPGTPDDLPAPFNGATEPLPPLGGALGMLTILDASVATAAALSFAAFEPTDVFDVPFEDFARLERPRIASFAIGGELPEGERAAEPTRRSA
jgi:hypothetical protein